MLIEMTVTEEGLELLSTQTSRSGFCALLKQRPKKQEKFWLQSKQLDLLRAAI